LHNHLPNHFGGHDAFRVRFPGALPMPARAMTLANPGTLEWRADQFANTYLPRLIQ